MPTLSTPSPVKVSSRVLADWLDQAESDERELIIEAALPARRVRLQRAVGGRGPRLSSIQGAPASRQAVLDELSAFATSLLKRAPTVLRAAGALAVKVTPAQARKLIAHPLVRAIRPNRRLQMRNPREYR